MKLALDNTKRDCYAGCPRKYYWQFHRHLVSNKGSNALRYGSAIHNALENHYQGKQTTPDYQAGIDKAWEEGSQQEFYEGDYRTKENALTCMQTYANYYAELDAQFKVVSVEESFEVPMDITKLAARTCPALEEVLFIGRRDGVVETSSGTWILEHKTTSRHLKSTVESLHRTAQTIGYTYAGRQISEQLQGVYVNIIHTSGYFSKAKNLYTSIKYDFRRSPHIYTKRDLAHWEQSFLWTADQIAHSIENNHWPMQFDTCYKWGRCPYTTLCEQTRDSLDDVYTGDFVEKHWDPRN